MGKIIDVDINSQLGSIMEILFLGSQWMKSQGILLASDWYLLLFAHVSAEYCEIFRFLKV